MALACPTCRQLYSSGLSCPADGTALVAIPDEPPAQNSPPVPSNVQQMYQPPGAAPPPGVPAPPTPSAPAPYQAYSPQPYGAGTAAPQYGQYSAPSAPISPQGATFAAPRVEDAAPPQVVLGLGAAIGVAAVGAGVWAAVADIGHFRLSLIGVGIGFGVAWAMTTIGHLRGVAFGAVAAVLALAGCAVGDIAGNTLYTASQLGVSASEVFRVVGPATLINFDPLDGLFYFLAALVAFQGVSGTGRYGRRKR